MKRRQFLTSALALSSTGLAAQTMGAAPGAHSGRQFYELRKYQLRTGAGSAITEKYIADALIPALNRLGIAPVGAFNLSIGPDTPSLYLLLPSNDLSLLVGCGEQLRNDKEYLEKADAFWNAPENTPGFVRIESELLHAFEGWPQLGAAPAKTNPDKRVFQLRSYESSSMRDHYRKIEMFHSGEFEIFKRAGFADIFFADVLIGQRMPKLTYMVSVESLDVLNERWSAFNNDPQWKALTKNPHFTFEHIVDNVANLVTVRAPFSQI